MGIYTNNNLVADNGSFQTGDMNGGNPESGGHFVRAYLGYAGDYTQSVIPLVCLSQDYGIDTQEYASGRIIFARDNGNGFFGNQRIDFKMQKEYNTTTSYLYTEFHRDSSYIKKCRFTWNGKPWAGLYITPYSIVGHHAWFEGISSNYGFDDIGKDYNWYIPIYRTSDSTVLNSEIYNSLQNDG